jgi:hypothetical protein
MVNLNNIRHLAHRWFRKDYLKAKIDELETNNNTKNIRDLHVESMTSTLELI